MKLSIITINWNNANGLRKTIESVISQSYNDFEYLVIDGASTDGSVDIIKQYAEKSPINWLSEPDKGIYNAMNKGILRASGEYLHFLNSGDFLYDNYVVGNMIEQLEACGQPSILTGQLYKLLPNGTLYKVPSETNFSFIKFYSSSVNHPSTYIRKELFLKYGLYDESLRIVSDWKWFMQVIAFNGVRPITTDTNVAIFDMTGISSTNHDLINNERRKVLSEAVPRCYLADYDYFIKDIRLMSRIRRHPWAFRLVKLIERILFRIEKKRQPKKIHSPSPSEPS